MTSNTQLGNVGVFCGGTSRERDISLQSGRAVTEGLVKAGIQAEMVDTKNHDVDLDRYDNVFIALHGRDGEDGKIQSLLDYHAIPYTGSGVTASAVSMNKWYTKAVWQSIGIPTPDYQLIGKDLEFDLDSISPPVYVKPVNEGSSIGITHVTDRSMLTQAVQRAMEYDDFVLIEQEVSGEEYTYSFIEGQDELPLIKLEPAADFYDYDAKYLRDDTNYIVRPEMPEELRQQCVAVAKLAYQSVGLCGWGRVDFMVDDNQQPWFIELNSVPGMTSHSLVPMAAAAVGLDFSQTCVAIMENMGRG